MKTAATIEVTRTYLEMRDVSELLAARCDDPSVRVEQTDDCSASLYRCLYVEVGRNYHWIDRLPWTDEQIREHLEQPEIRLWLMTHDESIAGYFELRSCEDGSVEIAYFGLLPEFLGRGLGKHLLTCATEQAWAMGTNRVWLHTCTLDDPAALPNYLKRGFRPFKTENYTAEITSILTERAGESAISPDEPSGRDPCRPER
ncbi:MAG TPA: GNAT family N-acetyltransferase [Pyrinomonadaceae bacterium]|nr:GNAT family N-acetyltransferase [Pyrinomonadaceae bacterium]